MSDSANSSEANDAEKTPNARPVTNIGWWRRVTAWPAWLKVLCGASAAWCVLAASLRFGSFWCLAPATLVASVDWFAIVWRVFRDPESELLQKIAGATIGVTGAVFGHAYAAARVAEVLGADANIAPHCQQLLALTYVPLCIAVLFSIVLLVGGLAIALAAFVWSTLLVAVQTASGVLSHVLLLLYGWFVLGYELLRDLAWLATKLVLRREARVGEFGCRSAATPSAADHPMSQRLRRLSESAAHFPSVIASRAPISIRQLLRVGVLLIPMVMLPRLFEVESTSNVVTSAIGALAVKLDFRLEMTGAGNAECINLKTDDQPLLIASIPNVDDAVLAARCVRTFGEILNSSGPWCRFKREQCCRLSPCDAPDVPARENRSDDLVSGGVCACQNGRAVCCDDSFSPSCGCSR